MMRRRMLTAAADSPGGIPTDGLAFHWNADGLSGSTLTDLSGNGRTATLQGGAPIVATGWDLQNSGDFVRLDAPMTVPAGESVTYSTWINRDLLQGDNPGFWRSTGGAVGYPAELMNGDNFMIVQGGTGRPWVRWNADDILKPASGYVIPYQDWTHVLFVVESGVKVEFWADGALEHSAAISATTPSFDVELFDVQGQPAQYLKGVHNYRRWYRRALSAAEIQSLYEEGAPA